MNDDALTMTLREMKSALQDAHFAARRLDELLGAAPQYRPADEVHALRVVAGELGLRINELLRRATAAA